MYYELLPQGETINSEVYCRQLDNLKTAIEENRPRLADRNNIVFHQDNARPHISMLTRQKLLELGWDVLPHPPYSPDIAPSDFHLFRSLQNFLNGKILENFADLKNHLDKFFNNKDQKFWQEGIMKLPSRWLEIMQNNGTYISD